jgi:hypothetical protein
MKTTRIMRIGIALGAILLFSASSQLWALEIRGKVQSVSGNTALVVADGDVVPATGDRADFLSKAGASVASGKVIGRKETTMTVQITNGLGAVMKNQVVRFTSGEWKREDPIDVPNTFNEAQSVIEAQERNANRNSTPRPSPMVQARNDFAGRWRVQNENPAYILDLQERGGRVTGSYGLQGGSLSGAVVVGRLHATWKQPGNRRGGSVTFRLSADGNTLTGYWEYNPAIFSSGLQGSGTWTFQRISRSR